MHALAGADEGSSWRLQWRQTYMQCLMPVCHSKIEEWKNLHSSWVRSSRCLSRDMPPRPVVHFSGVPEILGSQKECGIRAYSFLSLKNVSRHWGLTFYGNSRSLCKLKDQGKLTPTRHPASVQSLMVQEAASSPARRW